ncbi:hypothetical protein F442_01321 [Phytophthora nicotianae P10297]|uniref:Uncharacterized protein n=1 Tax=Phytophthora nicotianae P10297 TaxID=1317064 RepID=W3A3P2_PHYNI|nr:hypothetical protein F442_01321 [Phytophthora nicotianae P10297]
MSTYVRSSLSICENGDSSTGESADTGNDHCPESNTVSGNDGRPVPNSGFGNNLSGSDADSVMTDNYNSEEWRALPLFEWRSSNFVESENNAMLDNGIRTSAPFNALYSIAVVEMERLVERNRNLEEWQKDHRDLTPYAKKTLGTRKEPIRAIFGGPVIEFNVLRFVYWQF